MPVDGACSRGRAPDRDPAPRGLTWAAHRVRRRPGAGGQSDFMDGSLTRARRHARRVLRPGLGTATLQDDPDVLRTKCWTRTLPAGGSPRTRSATRHRPHPGHFERPRSCTPSGQPGPDRARAVTSAAQVAGWARSASPPCRSPVTCTRSATRWPRGRAGRVDRLYRTPVFLRAGLRVPGSSDRPVASGAPLLGIQSMVRRISSGGTVIGRTSGWTH